MNESDKPMLNVTITFLPAPSDGSGYGESSVRGVVAGGSGTPVPFSGWLELMGELERLTDAELHEGSDPLTAR